MQTIVKGFVAGLVAALIGWSAPSEAANFSFTGNLANPGQVLLFNFNVGAPSDVTLVTYSYSGGTNAAGTMIPQGGFDPILALFSSSGALIGQNDDGGGNVPADAVTGQHYDTFLFLPALAAGSYSVSVSVFPNFANGPNLSNGFQGATTFTDVTGDPRTSNWAFDILNVNSAVLQGVPEPASLALLGAGLLGLGLVRRGRKQDAA